MATCRCTKDSGQFKIGDWLNDNKVGTEITHKAIGYVGTPCVHELEATIGNRGNWHQIEQAKRTVRANRRHRQPVPVKSTGNIDNRRIGNENRQPKHAILAVDLNGVGKLSVSK